MEKCTIGLLPRVIASIIIICFFLPETFAALYLFLSSQQSAPQERLLYLLGVFVFGGILVYSVYRLLVRGLVWVEYNGEKVIFHYSRSEEYTFRWEEIPSGAIQVQPDGGGYIFCIEGEYKDRKIPLNHFSKGFRKFKKMMAAKGVLKRIGMLEKEDLREIYRQFYGTSAEAPRPKPDGPCVVCPDCEGKGVFVKRAGALNLEIRTTCKTCGGTGYLSRK